jgi:aminopeptidase C
MKTLALKHGRTLVRTFIFIMIVVSTTAANAQITTKCPVYQFEYEIMLPSTPVKNQAVTGTCWSFATTSFIESELIRMGKGEYDLSEMYSVRYNYINRIMDNYLKRGKGNLQEGSLSNMVFDVIDKHGMVPEEIYDGINYQSETHDHSVLNQYIKAISEVPVNNRTITPQFTEILNSLLDIYLGDVPADFEFKGKEYTPQSFFESLNIDSDDYLFFTSFTHHPYYEEFVLEIPDNWNGGRYYNLPLEEFMEVIDNALENGYSVCWDGDMSEKSYSDAHGIAVMPTEESINEETGNKLSFNKIYAETTVTQESRQQDFENFTTTDDHLMHLIGRAKDKNGTAYYVVKNSWKPEINRFGGYNHLSEEYVKAKTISVVVHKNAIPSSLTNKIIRYNK